MSKDKRNKSDENQDDSDPKKNAAEKDAEKLEKNADKREKKEEKQSAPLDLDKLKNTTATQAPRVSPIAGTVRAKPAAPTAPKIDWKITIFGCIGSMFLGFMTHIFGINTGLVFNDRYNLSYILSQEAMGRMSQNILTDMLGVSPLSQPWLRASFIGDQGEYGLNFIWYHVVNVFWHAATAGLFFLFVLTVARHLHHQNRLKLNPHHLACAAAGIFACHPLTCESVTYLSARSSLLGANNFFQALDFILLAFFVKHPFARFCFAAMALFAGGMCIWSNPECITLPAVALISLLLIKHPLSKWQDTVKEHPYFIGLGLALSVLLPFSVMLGIQYTTANNLFLPTLSSMSYAATQFKAFTFYYLRCFVLPFGLSVDPPMAVAGSFSDPFAIAGIAVVCLLAFLVFGRTKQAILGFAVILVLAGLVPHGLMLQPDAAADWVTYLPLSGLVIALSYAICSVFQNSVKTGTIIFGVLCTVLCGLSIYRDLQWSSNLSLFQSAITFRPKSGFSHANLAIEYLKRQEIDKAEKESKLASSYAPEMVMSRIAQGKVASAQGKYEDSMKIFTGALNLANEQKLSHAAKAACSLGLLEALIGQKKENEANQLLGKLFGELQADPKLIYVVGIAAFQAQDYEKAFKLLDKAVASDPSLTECYQPMAESAMALGAFEPAYTVAKSGVDTLGTDNLKLLFSRAAIMTKREIDAEDTLKQMLQTDPKNARALYLMSRLYKRKGNAEEWKKYRENAIKLDPEIAIKFALPEIDAEEASTPSPEQGKAPSSEQAKAPSPEQGKAAGSNSSTEKPQTK